MPTAEQTETDNSAQAKRKEALIWWKSLAFYQQTKLVINNPAIFSINRTLDTITGREIERMFSTSKW